MELIFWIIIFGVLGGVLGFVSSSKAKAHYTSKEILNSAISSAIAGLIVGAAIGVLLSLFAIFNIGVSGLLATLVLGLVGALVVSVIFFLATFVSKGLSNLPLGNKIVGLLTGMFVGAFVGLLLGLFFSPSGIALMPEYIKFADPLRNTITQGAKELAKFRHCLYADPRCPFFVPWEDPNIQSFEEELSVDVEFSERKILPDNTINLLVSLSVSNPELVDLHIKPKCYFKKDKERELDIEKMGAYAFGDEFVFGTTAPGQEFHTTFRCTGEITEAANKNVYTDYVIVELERPVTVKTTWPVWIGSEPKIGIVRSEMKFNAPYMIALGSNNDMPFEEGKEYDFQLTIKRKDETTKLKDVEQIIVKFPEDILASCKYFEGLDHEFELSGYDHNALKNLAQYDKEYDKFIFPCNLYVMSAPRKAVMAPFELEAYYNVYSDYSTRIIKSP